MSGHHSAWVERLNFVERRDPFSAALNIRLGDVEMNVVVGGVPGDHQANRRHMQTGRVVSVGMADFYDNQVVPFEIDHISLEFVGDDETIRDLAWKESAPEEIQIIESERSRGALVAGNMHNSQGS